MRGDLLRRSRWHRSGRSCLAALLALFASLPGCQLVGGYEKFEGVEPHPCDVLTNQEKFDERGVSTLVLSKAPNGSCFWISRTETTVEQYQAFLDAPAEDWKWGDDCEWKAAASDPATEIEHECTVEARVESDPFRSSKPIRCIDWCDAQAFCRWSGMELCGGLSSGGLLRPTDVQDEWGKACAEKDANYAYGSEAVAFACNIGIEGSDCREYLEQSKCAPTDVDTFEQCESPAGNMDMLGNVAEWALMCGTSTENDFPREKCQTRGGSFESPLSDHCFTAKTVQRDARERTLGMRCCDQLNANEERELREATPP